MDILDGKNPLKMICDGWLGKIRRAIEIKAPWQDIADECMAFFSASTGFLWDSAYKHKFWDPGDGAVNPKFKLTIAKAFELVAIFGPVLYWRNPIRTATPREPIALDEDLQLMLMGADPSWYRMVQQAMAQFQQQDQQPGQQQQEMPPELQQASQMVQQIQQQLQQQQQQQATDMTRRRGIGALMERYLNWTPHELDLHRHAEVAITEALVKGRSVLWSEPYQPPGTDRLMVGSFWDSVDNLQIDPDAESLDEAWWIAKRCTRPIWSVERAAKLRPGSLRGLAHYESANAQGERMGDDMADSTRARGDADDLMVFWKIWSRCGPGSKLTGVHPALKEQLEKVVGDYAYLEIAEGIPFPLNLAGQRIMKASSDEVKKAFSWPTPHWRDGKWPMEVLDFYPVPRKVWPLAPLAPGLGELKAINVLMSHLCSRVWMSSRDFIAVLDSVADSVEDVISKGEDLSFLRLTSAVDDVNKAVQFLQQPETRLDYYKLLNWLFELFDKRTGLTELAYGLSPGRTQDRTATGAQIKQQNMSVRPDHMAAKVEGWMTNVALREALTVRWWIEGRDVEDLLGAAGAKAWDTLIVNTEVERTVRDIDFRLEAGTAKKPNRDRDVANINEAFPMLGPILQGREQMTGDYAPINALIEKWGKAVEMDTSAMQSQAPPPQQGDETEQMMAQQEMQLEQQKAEMEMQLKQQQAGQESQLKQQEFGAEQARDQQEHVQELQQDRQSHQQEMTLAQQKANLEARLASLKARAAAAAAKSKANQQQKASAA